MLKVGITRPGSLDPGDAYDPMGQLVVATMCDSMLAEDPKTGELRSSLAAKWVVTGDFSGNTQLIFSMKHGRRYSNGQEVKAIDAVNSLGRMVQEDFASRVADRLSDVSGYEAAHRRSQVARPASPGALGGVMTTDPYGFQVSLDRLSTGLLNTFADPITAPVRDVSGSLVCAGPYRLESPWNLGSSVITLVRSSGYVSSSTALTRGGRGYADRIEFHIYPTAAAADVAFQRGLVDVAPVDLLGRARFLRDIDLVEGNDPYQQVLSLPGSEGSPFADAHVRRALSAALDRGQLAATVYGGGRVPANAFVPPWAGFEATDQPCGAILGEHADLGAARAELSLAGLSLTGKPLVIAHNNDDATSGAVVRELARQWGAAFGLRVTAAPEPPAAFVVTAAGGGSAARTRGVLTGFSSGDGSGAAPYLRRFTTSALGAGGNITGYSDAVFDRFFAVKLLGAADSSSTHGDQVERRLAATKAQALLCPALPVIPVVNAQSHWLMRAAAVMAAGGHRLDIHGRPLLRELSVIP